MTLPRPVYVVSPPLAPDGHLWRHAEGRSSGRARHARYPFYSSLNVRSRTASDAIFRTAPGQERPRARSALCRKV